MIKFSVILLVAISLGMVYDAYGHGIGAETLPPQDLGDKHVFVQVNAINVADSEIDQQFTFQLMNMQGQAVNDVTYQIMASKQGTTLFDEKFESGSGTLVIDLIHSDSDEIQVEKQASGVFGFISGDTDLAKVTGPYFDYGGLYQFNIKIITAEGFSNNLNPPLEWNSGISIADTTMYGIDDVNFGKQTLTHVSYYDIIEDFKYDPASRSISFKMPFDGNFESINQTSVVHEEITFSKDFGDLMVSDISVTVNGVVMPEEVIQIDDFTGDKRIVHLTMIKNNLLELYEQDKLQNNKMSFVIEPSEDNLPLATVTKNGQFKVVMETNPLEVKSGQELEIKYKLLDVFLKDRPVKVDYDLYVVQEDKMLFSTKGTSNDEVGKFDSIQFFIPEQSTGVIYVHFENLVGNSLASAKLPIVVDRISLSTISIPSWIKNHAEAWHIGIIDDQTFVTGIEWLISNEVVIISETQTSTDSVSTIPSWIKTAAQAWTMGITSDEEFVNGIQFLISNGIIKV